MKTGCKPILLITGASKGIGAALAAMAAPNYTVVVNYRHDDAAAERIAHSIQKQGGNVLLYKADISDEIQTEKMFSAIKAELGPISHLVNNAAVLFPRKRFMDIHNDRFNKTFSINIFGVINTVRCAIPHFKMHPTANDKAIVNISSGAAKTGAPHDYVDYAMSKGAVESLSMGLAKEMAADGVRVNVVRPGIIDTDIHENKERRFAELKPSIPLNRIGVPGEVAEGILWLLSAKAAYVSGSILDITGGR